MNITADGNTDIATIIGKEHVFRAKGTFGSGTLTLQWVDGGVATTIRDANGAVALTAAGAVVVVAPSRMIRVALSGSSGASIDFELVPVVY